MQYLVKGCESKERIQKLIQITSMRSEPTIAALLDHFVTGLSVQNAAALNQIRQSNLTRAIKRLNQAAKAVDDLKGL